MIIDAHNHLHLLSEPKLRTYGVERATVCGTSPEDWDRVLELAESDPAIVPAIGLHPWFIANAPGHWLPALAERLLLHPNAAVGEIGLDRTRRSPDLAEQKEVLVQQLDLAARLDRPVVLHCVRAYGHLFDTLNDSPLPMCGVMLHGFGGAPEMVARFCTLPVPVFFSISSAELLGAIPRDRLLVESDASADNAHTPDDVIRFVEANDLDWRSIGENYFELFGS